MRIIDRKWTDLSLGSQAVQTFQSRLEAEFGRAVEVGHRQKYRRELTEWQKKRRIFFALVALAPISIIALCLTAYYFREMACVLIWWLVTVSLALIALVVAGWSYIRQMISGQPVPKHARVAASLTDRWWDCLAPKALTTRTRHARGEVDFLTLLDRALPDEWLAVCDLFTSIPALSSTGILLLGPSGIWNFEVKHWNGTLAKQEGRWKDVRKKRKVTILEEVPDEQWVRQKDAIINTIHLHLPHLSWASDLVQGGVAFSHPRVKLEKDRIQGNAAPSGPVGAWVERMSSSLPVERFTQSVHLEILDALIAWTNSSEGADLEYVSSRDEAERLYDQSCMQFRDYVSKMVK